MSARKGIKAKGDATTCMVVGCDRIALYKNPTTAGRGVVRGYCREHKAWAIANAPSDADSTAEWMQRKGIY